MAAPTISRLTPPSALFSYGDPTEPYTSRFWPGQKFDLQCTATPDAGTSITKIEFWVDNKLVGTVMPTDFITGTALTSSLENNGTVVASWRAYANMVPGVHNFSAKAYQSDGTHNIATGNFEIHTVNRFGRRRAKNIIVFIGDGMGIAHRTAARIMLNGVSQGKPLSPLAMDTFPHVALLSTHSLNSIVTDSSPGAACYSTGNKSNNNQHGVFPDDTDANFDNPRVELLPEYLARTQGKSLGIVTTADVFDATPGAWGSHTQSRSAGTGICDQYLDDSHKTGLAVLMGGGRKWFLPSTTPGSARNASSGYSSLPNDLVSKWGINIVPNKTGNPTRDLIADFQSAGFTYAPDATTMMANANSATKMLGLFSLSNMNVALDKINKRRGTSTVVDDYGFPDQPMLEEMTDAALKVLSKDPQGFVLMVEAASIDKQSHNMDTERWILDTIEFDRAIAVARNWAANNPDTLIVVTADHECAGINIIGGSRVTNANLTSRAAAGLGTASGGLRSGVVGTYESAGFPRYTIASDGYPTSTDPDYKMLIGYAANADRYEDWLTNAKPLRDSQQPFNNQAPLNTYPSGPTNQDVAGGFLVTGQIADPVAAHTGSDIPLSAWGRGASQFSGVMDNTDVFFRIMQAAVAGVTQ